MAAALSARSMAAPDPCVSHGRPHACLTPCVRSTHADPMHSRDPWKRQTYRASAATGPTYHDPRPMRRHEAPSCPWERPGRPERMGRERSCVGLRALPTRLASYPWWRRIRPNPWWTERKGPTPMSTPWKRPTHEGRVKRPTLESSPRVGSPKPCAAAASRDAMRPHGADRPHATSCQRLTPCHSRGAADPWRGQGTCAHRRSVRPGYPLRGRGCSRH
jgi:hypothetical protein